MDSMKFNKRTGQGYAVSVSKGDGEEFDLYIEGSCLAFGSDGFVIVEGFLGIPALDVGAHRLSGRDWGVDPDSSFVELTSFHVGIRYPDLKSAQSRLELVGDEETFHTAIYSLVESIETDGRTYAVAERY